MPAAIKFLAPLHYKLMVSTFKIMHIFKKSASSLIFEMCFSVILQSYDLEL